MATHNDPDHHDVFPGGKAGVEIKPRVKHAPVTVTQSDIDDVLRRAGLPTSEETPTRRPESFSDSAAGLEIYFPIIDREAYLRAPGAAPASVLAHPLY